MTRSIHRGYPWPPARAKPHSYEQKPPCLERMTAAEWRRMIRDIAQIDWAKMMRKFTQAIEAEVRSMETFMQQLPAAVEQAAEVLRSVHPPA
jgi:hypothetical protein